MTFQQELGSWWSPAGDTAPEVPKLGQKAPRTKKLPLDDNRPKLITFLRHCGCPFAEKTFLDLRESARKHRDVDFVAFSHSDEEHTQTWLKSLPQAGSEPDNLRIIVDADREVYGAFGLGPSTWTEVLSPGALYAVYRLGKETGIWNRPTESGSRWQTAGSFLIDANGVVKWGGRATRSDDMPDFENALAFLEDTKSGESKL